MTKQQYPVDPGTRWEHRNVDRGPENDFTIVEVVRSSGDRGFFGETGQVYCFMPPCPRYPEWNAVVAVLYRRTGSTDIPTKMSLDQFRENFMPYGTVVTDLGKMTVTATRPSGGVPWWLLAAGAALLLS